MGIVANALVIGIFGLLGSVLKKTISNDSFRILGICIVIVSIVGFFENLFTIQNGKLISDNLPLLLIVLIIGNVLGEKLHISQHLSNLVKSNNAAQNAVTDSFLYFGIGGLQICGPITMVMQGDNSQLFLKSMIDIPFAIMFGATYGPWVALAAIPVALVQIAIALITWCMGNFFTEQIVKELCSLGFIILFFCGYNLFSQGKNKIDNLNMLPSIFIILLYHGIRMLFI